MHVMHNILLAFPSSVFPVKHGQRFEQTTHKTYSLLCTLTACAFTIQGRKKNLSFDKRRVTCQPAVGSKNMLFVMCVIAADRIFYTED